MTIQAFVLDSGGDNADQTSYTTNTVTLGDTGPGRLILLGCASIANVTSTDPTSVSGVASGWTLVTSQQVFVGNRRIWLYRGIANATGTITIDFGVTNLQTGFQWGVVAFGYTLVGGTNGADAIVQFASSNGGGTGTSLSITLAAFAGAAHNVALGCFHHAINQVTTPEAGYTELVDVNHASPAAGFQMEAFVGEDLSVSASWLTDSQRCGIACEIAASIHPSRQMFGVGR